MDLLSWLAGPDNADNDVTSRTMMSMNSSSHMGVYRRSSNTQPVKKANNPGIYSGGKGPSRGGCLAGMRGFEPINEIPEQTFRAAPEQPFRSARSLSPQKLHREPLRRPGAQQFQPSNSSLLRDHSWSALGTFTHNRDSPQPYPQANSFKESSQNPYLLQAYPSVYQHAVTNHTTHKAASAVVTGMSVSKSDVKSDVTPSTSDHVTPSTSDHSDVDDLAPRSIHSPSTSDADAQTPPSSGPGSPSISTVSKSCSLQDAGSSSDSSEKPQKPPVKVDAVSTVKKTPFASLDLQDQGIVKARTCTRNALQLNKSLKSECRSLEDEMSDLTKDLEALREQLKNHRGHGGH
eukprot:gnl/MRDRNA2_/MRDRNA2_30528_c0_seq1.p1 gnl/MRDRNA2_/MRDRNA2_30528_c0~~gnl/MRDRNA2_/MRDRNA2_30528_c0_seq1.p1  ORF type:complete len:347 (+),score=55.72 gnl/MRDRNA2_/MRDRNA2_30528_c0_seq1:97-1137(+)